MTVGVEMVEMGREVLVGDTIKANKSIDVCLYKALKWVHVNLYICILINVRISNSVPKQFTKTLSLKNIIERDLMPNSKQAKSNIEAWILNFTNYKSSLLAKLTASLPDHCQKTRGKMAHHLTTNLTEKCVF